MISDDIVIQADSNGNKVEEFIKKEIIGNGGFARCYLMINKRTQ